MSKKLKEHKKKKHKKLVKASEDYASKLELDSMLIIKPSPKTKDLLARISKHGIYGTTTEMVAERFIDEVVQRFVDVEDVKIKI